MIFTCFEEKRAQIGDQLQRNLLGLSRGLG